MYYDRTDISEGIDLARSSNSKHVGFAIIVFLIMDSNFKIMYAMVPMFWQCCVLG